MNVPVSETMHREMVQIAFGLILALAPSPEATKLKEHINMWMHDRDYASNLLMAFRDTFSLQLHEPTIFHHQYKLINEICFIPDTHSGVLDAIFFHAVVVD